MSGFEKDSSREFLIQRDNPCGERLLLKIFMKITLESNI